MGHQIYPMSKIPESLSTFSGHVLEHVPEKLIDFSDENMLRLIDLERFPIGGFHPIGKRSRA